MHIHVHTDTHMHTRAHKHTHIRAHTHTCTHMHTRTYTHPHTHVCTQTHVHTCTHTRTHMNTHIHTHGQSDRCTQNLLTFNFKIVQRVHRCSRGWLATISNELAITLQHKPSCPPVLNVLTYTMTVNTRWLTNFNTYSKLYDLGPIRSVLIIKVS